MRPEEELSINNLVPEEKERRVFAKVFSESAVRTIHQLATKGYFDVLEFVISTGKEVHVFRARDVSGNYRAVKIYKIETSNFRNMAHYLEGDMRFKETGRDKRSIVFAWTKKEFKNLDLANKAGARVPLPIASKDNVLVMEFIGENGKAAKPLKEIPVESLEIGLKELYEKIVENIARLAYKAKMVHADLSEYNILMLHNKEPVLIDIGQGVLLSHPNAKDFFDRDIQNIASWFSRNGLKKSFEEVLADVRALKGKV